ncbi:predicted protein [Histoplasma capsulatum G186AR]|uniref:Uncharacterized protein n=1 Tax=Ajellomyces capsulatus (strain G186AR / H82 / ATCC MYA-2454 / RMSCC 2432) TaxID=447093 RepID=C0ND58_AJECG|nr:uncharacterized protein HCBG_01054 [Histoplasma capsulatum G186AR]EEH11599.1 predicted protein [Histoplasma capsulatum G186AR]
MSSLSFPDELLARPMMDLHWPTSTSRSCSGAGKVTSLAFSVGDRRARELSLILRIGGFVVVVVMVVMHANLFRSRLGIFFSNTSKVAFILWWFVRYRHSKNQRNLNAKALLPCGVAPGYHCPKRSSQGFAECTLYTDLWSPFFTSNPTMPNSCFAIVSMEAFGVLILWDLSTRLACLGNDGIYHQIQNQQFENHPFATLCIAPEEFLNFASSTSKEVLEGKDDGQNHSRPCTSKYGVYALKQGKLQRAQSFRSLFSRSNDSSCLAFSVDLIQVDTHALSTGWLEPHGIRYLELLIPAQYGRQVFEESRQIRLELDDGCGNHDQASCLRCNRALARLHGIASSRPTYFDISTPAAQTSTGSSVYKPMTC